LRKMRPNLGDARDLEEVEFDRRLAPKEGHEDADLPLLGIDRVNDANEVRERPVHHLDTLTLGEADLDPRRLHLHAAEDPFDLGLLEGARMRSRADEA